MLWYLFFNILAGYRDMCLFNLGRLLFYGKNLFLVGKFSQKLLNICNQANIYKIQSK